MKKTKTVTVTMPKQTAATIAEALEEKAAPIHDEAMKKWNAAMKKWEAAPVRDEALAMEKPAPAPTLDDLCSALEDALHNLSAYTDDMIGRL
jgi:hypothetical protein